MHYNYSMTLYDTLNYCTQLSIYLQLYVQGGGTSLSMAGLQGHQKCAELLIEAGANVDVADEVRVTCYAYVHPNVTTAVSTKQYICIATYVRSITLPN